MRHKKIFFSRICLSKTLLIELWLFDLLFDPDCPQLCSKNLFRNVPKGSEKIYLSSKIFKDYNFVNLIAYKMLTIKLSFNEDHMYLKPGAN